MRELYVSVIEQIFNFFILRSCQMLVKALAVRSSQTLFSICSDTACDSETWFTFTDSHISSYIYWFLAIQVIAESISEREREISLKGYRCTRLLFYLFNWRLFLSPVHLRLGRPPKALYWIQYIHKIHFHIPSDCADHDIHFHAECFHLFKPPDGLEPRCGVRWWQTLDSSSLKD